MIEQEKLLGNPFPGLRPFSIEESEVFFGRDGQSDQVLTKLGATRFVAVVGTSGSGKSSLVSAGVLPALLSGHLPSAGSSWRIASFRPGSSPIRNLAETLSAPNVCGTKDQESAADRLENIERTLRRSSLGLLEVVRQFRMKPGENLLILADQFEELFRFRKKSTAEHPEDEAAAFVKLLLEAKQPDKTSAYKLPIYVVLTMRSDYLGDCAHFWGLPEAINEGQFLIPRMTDDNRREAIIGPVILGGGEITPTLVNRLLNDAGDDPAQLPILQHALMRTWDYWKTHGHAAGTIDIPHYEKIGGMKEALSNHADEAYGDLSPELQEIASKVFKSLTEKEADNREGRRPATIAEIAGAANVTEEQVQAVVESFRREDRSFLMPPSNVLLKSDTLIDISHESLIRGWVRLRAWVDEEAEAARHYVRLADKAALFPKDEPHLAEPALSNALKWLEGNPTKAWADRYHPGFEKTMEYLYASLDHRQQELAETERLHKEKVERDLLHAKAIAAERGQRVKQLRWGLGLMAILLIGMFAVTVYAFRQQNFALEQKGIAEGALKTANEEKARAETQKGIAEGALITANEEKAKAETQKGIAEGERKKAVAQKKVAEDATKEADRQRAVAVGALASAKSEEAKAITAAAEAKDAKEAADRARIRAEEALATIKEIDLSQPYAKAAMRDSKQAIRTVAISPDGNYIVTASGEGHVQIYKAPSGDPVTSWAFDGLLNSATFSHDSKFIAAAGDKGLGRWNVEQKSGQTYDTEGKEYSSVVFSPDDKIIAAIARSTEDLVDKQGAVEVQRNLVELWDPAADKVKSLYGHTGTINTLTFSPKGKYLVTTSADKTARVWDPKTGKLVSELQGHLSEVNSAAFSPDETLVVTASNDRTAHVWNAATGEILQRRTLSDEVQALVTNSSFSSAEKAAITASLLSDNPTQAAKALLDGSSLTDEQKQLRVERSTLDHPDPVTSVRFSPDGNFILTTSGKDAYLWESENNWLTPTFASPSKLEGHEAPVTGAAFSPDSNRVVTISQDRTAQLWRADVTRGAAENPFGSLATRLAVFRGHNKPLTGVALTNNYVVTGSEDKTARVWDLTGVGAFNVAGASLQPETPEYKGKCPVTFKLTGKINVTGKGGTVKYRFVRKSPIGVAGGEVGVPTGPQELVFDEPGSKEVSTTYDVYQQAGVGIARTKDHWAELEILEPVSLKSSRASFSVECDTSGQQTVGSSDLTSAQLAQIMPNLPTERREQYLPYLKSAMAEFGISTPLRQAAFLGQVAHESAEFRFLEELGNGAYYEGRKDLGNIDQGDGARFKGRGAIHIVGRANYKRFGEKLGVDLMAQPTLAASPEVAFRLAALIWQTYGLNEIADKQDYRMITKRINGGYNGLADRIKYYERARQVLGIPPTP